MKKLTLFVFLVLGNWLWVNAQQADVFVPGVYHVKVSSRLSQSIQSRSGKAGVLQSTSALQPVQTGIAAFDAANAELKTVEMTRMFPYHPKYEARQQKSGLHLWYVMKVDQQVPTQTAVQRLMLTGDVQQAQPAPVPTLYDNGSSNTMPTNDPRLWEQWHYNNTGQRGGTPGADINLFEAWKISMGNANVVVAIMDGGIDINHEDLKDNLWVNQAELNGNKGDDDDDNGYKDDIYGYNFTIGSGTITAHPHGTHVAGTVGAVNNNGKGVAGVAGGSGKQDGVRLMSCQIFSSQGGTNNTAAPYVYAANNGAVISQNSWGWNSPNIFDQATLDAIDYFIRYAGTDENGNPLPDSPMNGGIVIFAAGNSSSKEMYYPGCYEPTFSVAALDQYNKRAAYSNYGTWVDISAPGGYTRESVLQGVLSTLPNNNYGYMDGTSMACPHVSGVAALILSKYGSAEYTPDMLAQRMLMSCKDIYSLNPTLTGQLGAGLIDAAKALAPNTGEPPVKVAISAINISRQFLDITFTAPSDPDNGKAYRYEIRYAEEPITPDSYSKLPSITKIAKEAGELDTIRMNELKPLTKYYVALRSYDVWGNYSELSNVLEATTTGSPKIQMALNSPADITIDFASNPIGFSEFTVSNLEEGALQFSTGSHIAKDPRPIPSLSDDPIAKLNISPGADNYADYLIGEDGESVSFYAANRYQVNSEEFNLTHIQASLSTINAQGDTDVPPFRIKVVRGGVASPAGGVVVYDEEFNYKSWYSSDEEFDLGEQIKFLKGEYLWVIFAFPKEYKRPMGANYRIKNSPGLSLYSVDDEISWENIDALKLYEPQVIFRIFALSRQLATNQSVTFAPEEGTLVKGADKKIKATFDVSKMLDGEYTMHLKAFSNDVNNAAAFVPVKLTVTGHKAAFRSDPKVDFATVVVGKQASATVVVSNDGLGVLNISNISTTAPFSIAGGVTSLTVPPKQQRELEVIFAPVTGENLTVALSMNTNDGGVKKIVLHGAGVEPPVIGIAPAKISFTGMAGEDIPSQTFKLKNTGKYELSFSIPAFNQEDNSTVIYKDKHTGYVAKMDGDVGAPTIAGWADMTDATDMTSIIETGNRCHLVDLGFTMPYYGKEYSSITLTPIGIVMMGEEPDGLPNNANSLPETGGRGKTIAPFWAPSIDIIKMGGKVLYKKFAGKTVVEFRKIGVPESEYNSWGNIIIIPATGTIDAQVALFNDGRIEFRYKNFIEDPDINSPLMDQLRLVGIENEVVKNENHIAQNVRDGIQVAKAGQFSKGSEDVFLEPENSLCIGFYPPLPKFVKSVTPNSGIIVPNDEQEITVALQIPDHTLEGLYASNIHISSNDPDAEKNVVEVEAVVKAESKPVLNTTSLDFASIYKGADRNLVVNLTNEGGKPFNVTSVTTNNAAFAVQNVISGTTCEGFASLEYRVTFTPTDATSYAGKLTIATDADGYQSLEVALTGAGMLSGNLQLDDNAPHVYNLNSEGSNTFADTFIAVNNTGEAPLEVAVGGSQWIKPLEMNTQSNKGNDRFGYYWVDNTMDESLQFNWIMTDNVIETNVYRLLPRRYELPFTFTFYGKEYNELAISAHGQILFPTDEGDFVYNAENAELLPIPKQDDINNIICILRRLMYPKSSLYVDARVMIESFEDMFVISWVDMLSGYYGEWSQNTSITAQIILYKDGRIKLQYKDVDKAKWCSNSQVCIENYDGTDGLDIYLAQGGYIKDKLAIMITPSVKYQIPEGETRKINLRVDAEGLFDGSYPNGEIIVTTNAPKYSVERIPVNLTVAGTPNIAVNNIDYGLSYVYETAPGTYMSYEAPIAIVNKGTKKVTISEPVIPQWFELVDLEFPLVVDPNTTITTTLRFTPQAAEGVAEKSITFDYAPEGSTSIVVGYNTMLPPKTVLEHNFEDKQLVTKVLPGEGYKHTTPIVVKNSGDSQLSYQFEIAYISWEDTPSASESAALHSTMSSEYAHTLLASKDAVNQTSSAIVAPYNNSFVDVIGYGQHEVDFMGGLNTPIRLDMAARFQVEDEGFNLTHVGCWYKSYLEGEELEVRIMTGRDFKTAREIHSEKLTTRKTNGEIIVDQLSKNFYFYPGECFWIVYGQSIGLEYSFGAFMLDDPSASEHFYMAFMDGENYWCNSIANTYGRDAGYIMDAYSAERKDGVESWITLPSTSSSSTNNSGLLEINTSDSYGVELNSKVLNGDYRDRYAVIRLQSNDPQHNTDDLYVTFAFNQAPIIQATDKISMYEGEDANVDVTVSDPDGDNVTLTLALQNAAEGAKQPTTTINGADGAYTITVNAPMGSEGEWTYLLTATDKNQLATNATLTVSIEMGEYAPAIVMDTESTGILLREGERANVNITVTDKNDNLATFVLVNDNANTKESAPIASLDSSNSGYVFTVNTGNGSAGRWVYHFEAEDATGLRTQAELIVTVEATIHEFSLYPNPATTHITVSSQLKNTSNVEILIYNSIGELALRQRFDGVKTLNERLDITNLPSGMYILQYLVNGHKEETKRFVK